MAGLLAAVMSFLGLGNADAKENKVADSYQGLRQQVLTLDPSKIGFSPSDSSQLWGVLMETGYSKATVTLATLADGTVSLYFSNGGGMIGLGQHEGPRKANKELLSFAQKFINQATVTKIFPLPAEGNTRFYFLTLKGVLTVEAREDDLGNNRSPLSPLFYKAQEVITQARIASEKNEAVQKLRGELI